MKIFPNYSFIAFTLLDTTLSEVKCEIDKYYSESIENNKYQIAIKEFLIEQFYTECPLQGSAQLKKVAFYNPKLCEEKLIMFSNVSDGWVTLANYLSLKLNCSHTTFYITTKENENSQNMFVHRNSNQEERVVYSMKEENKWIFFQEGKSQEFEKIENYEKRRIKERFNDSILVEFCDKLGLDIMNDNFWVSDKNAFYLEETILNRSNIRSTE